MAVLATTTLAEAITASAERIKLTTTEGVLSGMRLYIDLELMGVSSVVDGTWLIVQRGVDGTPAGGHLVGETVYLGYSHHFFQQDPVGLPPATPEITPWINVLTGRMWEPSGGEWVSETSPGTIVDNTADIEAIEVRLDAIDGSIDALQLVVEGLPSQLEAIEASQLADTGITDPTVRQGVFYNGDTPPLLVNRFIAYEDLVAGDTPAVVVKTAADVRDELDIAIRRTQFAIPVVADGAYPVTSGLPYASTLSNLKVKRVGTGTCTVAVQIGGVDVTSLTGIAPGTSYSTTASTGANTQAADAEVTLVVSSTSGTLALYGYVEHTL